MPIPEIFLSENTQTELYENYNTFLKSQSQICYTIRAGLFCV